MTTTRAGVPGRRGATGPTSGEAGRTARGAVWLATNGVVVKTSQTIVLLVLAATLAPEALGLVALSTVVVNASSQLAGLGTAHALIYWRGDAERAARTAVSIGIGASLVLTASIWAIAPGLSALLRAGDDGVPVVRGLVVTLPFVAVAAVTNELLRRRLAFVRRVVPDAAASVVGAVVAIALLANGGGVMSLVAGQVVQAVVTLLLTWCVHRPVLPGWRRDDARELLRWGAPLAGGNLLELVQLNVDYLVVSLVLGTAALGQYSLAYRIAFVPYLMLGVMIAGAAYPYLCRLHGRRLGEATAAVAAALATGLTPLCLSLALLADHVVLLGEKWEGAVAPLALLAAYSWLLGLDLVVLTALNAAGRPGLSMTLRLGHLTLLLGVLAVAAPLGLSAVALTQVALALALLVSALLVARAAIVGCSVRDLAARLRPASTSAVVMASVVVALRVALHARDVSLVTLLVLGASGLVAYAGTLWFVDRSQVVALGALLRPGAPDDPTRTATQDRATT